MEAETVNLTAAQAFLVDLGDHLRQLLGRIDTARAALAGRGLDTGTLDRLARVRAQTNSLAAVAAAGVQHLTDYHGQMEQAVNQTPETADTDFYRRSGAGPDALPASTTAEQPTEPPVPEDDRADVDEAFERAAAFIDATTGSHPQQAPPGQDLQQRPAEGYEDDDEQPWRSLPVRRPNVCEHVDTACRECLDSWSWGHELRVAEVPTTVDVDDHRGTADEYYTFEGDPERQLPPYWVARHGRTVTAQIEGRPVNTTLLEDDDRASAQFADECCDTTPTGPGAPRPGDRIEIAGEPGTGIGATAVTLSSSTPQGTGYLIEGIDEDGLPYQGVVDAWGYEIVRRPAQPPPAPAPQPEPPRPRQPDVMDLNTLSPGDQVEAYGSIWLYAGTHNGDAVLVEDLRADLDYGYTGYPENGFITATATTHRAVLASSRQISRG